MKERDSSGTRAAPVGPNVSAPRRRNRRFLVLVTHPIQYYAPVYRTLAQRGNIDLKVIYLSDAGAAAHDDPGFSRTVRWDVPLLDGYDYEVLQPGTQITSRSFWQRHDRDLIAALTRARPDWLLVYGYASRMNWTAVLWARSHGVKVAYTSDSNDRNPERFVPIKKISVGYYFRHVDCFLATSERNVGYLQRYGAPPARIHRIPFAIDVARFTVHNGAAPVPPAYDFLWAGKFIPRKRGQDFIAALASLAERSDRPIRACMLGDGPCRDVLQSQARTLPLRCTVDFPGFVNQQEMPAALCSARVFVFTSAYEPYGLAVTEAAAAGLAIVVTDNAGCVGATVLARPGVNALTYHAGDIPALSTAMESLLCDDDLRRCMQRASLDIAKQHDVTCAAHVIEEVITGTQAE